ncbi:asparagine synthase-related protein [Butyrivibrio sp. FC2001]|uniref:asparagine synthase-related protein n=1 Tax=Butyrivibrio sp. FC2001 TaxID=1280671 RepID=UPI0003F63B20|nr:asparagine synthase-related protein [Butyrivibrio sp. FC2001]
MSAIWGYIDFNNGGNLLITQEIERSLKEGYEKCLIDKYGEYVADSFCMGCGIQYFTKEAENEVLPIIDAARDIYFTADAIIDNRQELLSKLGYGVDDKNIPDARIIFEMFDRFGEDCLNDMLGIYTFVYYDKRNGICYIANDIIGNRALQYSFEDGKLFFSTLTQPICKAQKKSKSNMQWFADFLGFNTLAYCLDYESTPYEGIKRLSAAMIYKFDKKKVDKRRYWLPKPSTLKLKNDEEYKKLFIRTYSEAVDRLVRNDKLAMLLSGGLDSTSIVCMLANSDKAKNIKLRSYTAIPGKAFTKENGKYGLANEYGEVLRTKEFLNARGYDFETELIDLEGINPWEERIEGEEIFEMPYKSILNLLWMRKSLEQSYNYGARVVLYGSFGNSTISLGVGAKYLYDYLDRRKYFSFIKECWQVGRASNSSLKSVFMIMKNLIKSYHTQDVIDEPNMECVPLTKEAIEKYDIYERIKKEKEKFNDYKKFNVMKSFMFNENAFYNTTELSTRNSLRTGAVFRDPTIDKRVVELCMSLPSECYGKGDIPRRLVREYLKEYMPPNTQNLEYHGEQSADLVQRFMIDGGKNFDELKAVIENCEDNNFIDKEKAIEEIERVRNLRDEAISFDICKVSYTAMAIEMIKKIDNYAE